MKKIFIKTLFFLSAIILISYTVNAQQHSFKVLTFSGNVESKYLSGQIWNKVKIGEGLSHDREIKLGENSYTVLLYNDGRTMEIMNAGIFSIKELESKIRTSKITVTQKFANFVADEIMADKSKGKTMKEFAAVVRVKPNHIESAIPCFNSFLDPEINLVWYKYHSSKLYVLSILSSENTTLFMDLTDDTTYVLDISKLNLRTESIYKWYVFDADNPKIVSDTNSMTVLSEANKKSILDTAKILGDEISSAESPLNILSLGAFYESHNLNLEALGQFNKLFELKTGSEEYKILFAKFLLKNKLYVSASELFEEKIMEK